MVNVEDMLAQKVLTDRERKNIHILDLIRKNGPIAKTEISRLTGLNIVTVSNYIENFIEKKYVFEKGLDISTGGRRPILVDLNADLHYVVGVGISMFHIISLITDLKGKIVHKVIIERPIASGENLIGEMIRVTELLLEKSQIPSQQIAGIGVGMTGVIDKKAKTVRWWDRQNAREVKVNISIEDIFAEKFNVPVLVENDANAAVFGEKWSALSMDIKHMLYMYSSASCGIMINGDIYHGASSNVGGLGIWADEHPMQGDIGMELSHFEIDSFMIQRAREAEEKKYKMDSAIFSIAKDSQGGAITPTVIIKALKEQDSLAVEIIEEAGTLFGKKLGFLVNLLNPEIVIVGGGIEQAGSLFLDAVKKTVNRWAIDEVTNGLKIVPTQLGEEAVPRGAAAIVVDHVFAKV